MKIFLLIDFLLFFTFCNFNHIAIADEDCSKNQQVTLSEAATILIEKFKLDCSEKTLNEMIEAEVNKLTGEGLQHLTMTHDGITEEFKIPFGVADFSNLDFEYMREFSAFIKALRDLQAKLAIKFQEACIKSPSVCSLPEWEKITIDERRAIMCLRSYQALSTIDNPSIKLSKGHILQLTSRLIDPLAEMDYAMVKALGLELVKGEIPYFADINIESNLHIYLKTLVERGGLKTDEKENFHPESTESKCFFESVLNLFPTP